MSKLADAVESSHSVLLITASGDWHLSEEDRQRIIKALRSTQPEADAIIAAARYYAKHYLVDEYEDPRLCVDEAHHKAVVSLFRALQEK